MKIKVFLVLVLSVLILMLSLPVAFAVDASYTPIPDPILDDQHAYFINDYRFIEFSFLNGHIYQQVEYVDSNTGVGNIVTTYNNQDYVKIAVEITSSEPNVFTFGFYNYSDHAIDIIGQPYTLTTGAKYGNFFYVHLNPATYSVNQSGIIEITPFVNTTAYHSLPVHDYYDYYNIIPTGTNLLNNCQRRQYVFGQGTLLHNDILAIRSILNTVSSSLQSIDSTDTDIYNFLSVTLYDMLDQLIGTVTNIWDDTDLLCDLLSEYLEDFWGLGSNGYANSWRQYYQKIVQIGDNIYNFAADFNYWYHDYYIPKTDRTNELLELIYNAIYSDTPTTYPNDPEFETEVSNMVENESVYENNLDTALDTFSDFDSDQGNISGRFDFFSNGLLFVRFWFDELITGDTYAGTILLISLYLGIVILVLGKRLKR